MPGVRVVRGPVNGVIIERNGETLYIYGDTRPSPRHASMVLFTHHRRDVAWDRSYLIEVLLLSQIN